MPTISTDGWWGVGLLAGWVWISGTFIARLWVVHRNASRRKKIGWSLMLLVPLFGWVFYAGFFRIPEPSDIPVRFESYPPMGGV